MTVNNTMFAFVLIGVLALVHSKPSIETNGANLVINSDQDVSVKAQAFKLISASAGSVNVGETLSTLQSGLQGIQDVVASLSSMQKTLQSSMQTVQGSVSVVPALSQMADQLKSNASADRTVQDQIKDQLSTLTASAETNSSMLKVSTMQLVGKVDVLNASFAKLDGALSDMNGTGGIFSSINLRIDDLEDEVYTASQWDSVLSEGDFENDAHQATDIVQYNAEKSSKCGDGFKIVDISNDAPPTSQKYNYSLELGEGKDTGCIMEYEVKYNGAADTRHPKMCPGTYRTRAWVKVSADYDGTEILFHHRFYYTGGGTQGWFLAGAAGIDAGAWPRVRDVWTLCEFSVRLQREASAFDMYVGYPFRALHGKVLVTGLQFARVGGGTSNC